MWEKQSSFVFQAESGLTTISHNIAYNGPRAGELRDPGQGPSKMLFSSPPPAGINFNEDSIGGSTISANLVFNMCRESGDHG